MKKFSRSRKISNSKNSKRSKKNRKTIKRLRGGRTTNFIRDMYNHKFIYDKNGIPIPSKNIVKITNRKNHTLEYGVYVGNKSDDIDIHYIKKCNRDDSGKLVLNDTEPITEINETTFFIEKSKISFQKKLN